MHCRATLYVCLLLLAAVHAQKWKPECGTSVARGTPTIVNGAAAEYGAFPWHVGVYKRNSRCNYEQTCGGTLISPDLIISAAHCFYDEQLGTLKNTTEFVIAAGKYHRPYHWPESYVQRSCVKSIDIPSNYIGYSGNYGADIALVRVETPFNITELVKPVCMDWDSIYKDEHLQKGHIGKAVGWGLTEAKVVSNVLREISLPYVPFDDCWSAVPIDFRGFITPQDKLCAGYLNGSSVCTGDSGGGLCFESGGVWYLRGVVSAIPSQRDTALPCDHNQYAALTDVGSFLQWIRSAYNGVGIATNGCILPEQPKGGSYQVSCRGGKCDTENKPGSVIPTRSILVYRCEEGYILRGSAASTCQISGWSSVPACIKTCPPLALSSEDIVCKIGGKPVSCDSPIEPGTTAYLKCETFYKISGTLNSTDDEITCREGGVWDRPTLQCVPECGKAPDPDSLMNYDEDGNSIQNARFPWAVSIRLERDSLSQNGGTLIQPDLVLSGFKKQFFLDKNGLRRNITIFTVYAGFYYNFNISKVDYPYVSRIESMNYVGEYPGIVLLRLVTPFNLTTWIRPVCIDWDDNLTAEQLRKGNIGKVPIGLLKIEGTDERKSAADLAFVPREDCISMIKEEYRNIYTATELFCVHNSTNSSFRLRFESSTLGQLLPGTGIYFESNDVWYLRGVVNLLIPRYVYQSLPNIIYITYGNVGHYLEWIRGTYGNARIDSRGPSGCILPEQIKNGKFELALCKGACNNETGSRVPIGSIIVHRCDQGYSLVGKGASSCVASEWDPLPICVKQCPPLVRTDMDIVCKNGGEAVSCDSPLPLGATASLSCKAFFTSSVTQNTSSTSDEITCLEDGKWGHLTLQCTPVCGNAPEPETLRIYENDGKSWKHQRFPWVIYISVFTSDGREVIDSIDGVLIQPDLIISVNEIGFYLDNDGSQRDLKDFTIFGGIRVNVEEADYTGQEVFIKSLNFANRSLVNAPVLIRLVKPFEMTMWVRPVCIDWDERFTAEHLRNGSIGMIPLSLIEIQSTDPKTTEAEFTFVPREDCISMIKEEYRELYTSTDIFCAHNSTNPSHFLLFNEKLLKRLARGTGFFFESEGVWYLRGILYRRIPSKTLLSPPNVHYFTFTNVRNYLEWIRADYGNVGIGTRGPGGCILPEPIKDGRFELASCKGSCNIETGSRVPIGSIVVHRCDQSYSLDGKATSSCGTNGWGSLPICIKCGWAPDPESLFSYEKSGNLIQRMRFPWRVLFAHLKSPENWARIDGTMIQPDLVLSANQDGFFLDDNGHRRDHNKTMAYAGLYYNFNSTTSKYNYQQRSPIKSFSFANASVVGGLVLVRLAEPFRITTWARPICIDWDNILTADDLRKRNIGKIATHMLAIEGTDTRQSAADLAYVPREDCVSMIRKEFRHLYAANELFCAHNSTNSSRSLQLDSSTVEQLDPAIGFYFESEGVWYLRGVWYGVVPVSHVLPSSPNITYMRFINVGNFLGWIHATSEEDTAVVPI